MSESALPDTSAPGSQEVSGSACPSSVCPSCPSAAAWSPRGGNSSSQLLLWPEAGPWPGQRRRCLLSRQKCWQPLLDRQVLLSSLGLFKGRVCFRTALLACNSLPRPVKEPAVALGRWRCESGLSRRISSSCCSMPASVLTTCRSENREVQHGRGIVLCNLHL